MDEGVNGNDTRFSDPFMLAYLNVTFVDHVSWGPECFSVAEQPWLSEDHGVRQATARDINSVMSY